MVRNKDRKHGVIKEICDAAEKGCGDAVGKYMP